MIATMTVQSHRMQNQQDHRFSLNSNTAGAPLPLIPRRTASTSRPVLTHSPSLPVPTRHSVPSFSTTITTITPATPPRNDSDSSSSSSDGTRPTVRIRRIRGVRNNIVCPPELSTPIPTLTAAPSSSPKYSGLPNNATVSASHITASRPLLYTPGMPLRLSVESLRARGVSPLEILNPAESSAQGAKSASAFSESFEEVRLIRKKSGQLVKSSLKSSRSGSRVNLSVCTVPLSSKSEPTTPTSKAVHFDTKLEHVKLFLAEQKPVAVSRDGSPTDDTSGTDSDFPKFIFGDGAGSEDRRPNKKKLVMQVPNMPERINLNSDVVLEELTLAANGATIVGKVRVRNIAFSKCVAIRFTFDSWQTTSEVTGKYMESISEEFDRFSFTIRLNDLLARIEGKTLIVAVKYTVDGREMWDNNSGQNYLATFSKAKIAESNLSTPPTLTEDESSTGMVDLRSKLEKVVQNTDRTGPAFLNNHRRASSATADTDFRTSASLAARYDFASSLKSSWNPDVLSPTGPIHNRAQSFPASSTKANGSSIPWPEKSPSGLGQMSVTPVKGKLSILASRGSPRDLSEDAFHNFRRSSSEVEDASHGQQRNHQRGYFDLCIPPHAPGPASLMRTPPGTPNQLKSAAPHRFGSFPPIDASLSSSSSSLSSSSSSSFSRNTPTQSRTVTILPAAMVASPVSGNLHGGNNGDSELSTPSMVTPTSSRDSSPSPTELFMSLSDEESPMSPDTHYRQFLNKFCFFTGPGSAVPTAFPEQEQDVGVITRTQSASDIEEFLAGISPKLQALAAASASGLGPVSPTRSPSLDDLMLNRSGSLTPTASRLSFVHSDGHSQTGTPVLF